MPSDTYLVQVLLPLRDNEGRRIVRSEFDRVSAELTEKFGGATAFVRSPAKGLWENGGSTDQDDVVIIETMVDALDTDWWQSYREQLEARFRQKSIVVRSHSVRRM